MGPFEEVGDSGGVGVEEALLLDGDAISAPVYLNKFGQLGLCGRDCSVRLELRRQEAGVSTVGSFTRTNAYWILYSGDQRSNHPEDLDYELTVRPKTLPRALLSLHRQWTEP